MQGNMASTTYSIALIANTTYREHILVLYAGQYGEHHLLHRFDREHNL